MLQCRIFSEVEYLQVVTKARRLNISELLGGCL